MSGPRAPLATAALFAALGVLTSCAVGPGYGGDGYVGVGYAGDYYDPCCYDYGGWGGHYHVGPPPGGGYRSGYGHPPPGGPGHGGGEGGHGGGGHGGGGHGGGAPSIPGHPR
jgi:hypothetical protein